MYGIEIGKLLMLAGGIAWCAYVARRMPKDLGVMRCSLDRTKRTAVAGLWIVTAAVGMWVVGTSLGLAKGLLFVAS